MVFVIDVDVEETGVVVHTFFEITEGFGCCFVEMGVVVTGWAAPFYRTWFWVRYNQRLEKSLNALKERLELFK